MHEKLEPIETGSIISHERPLLKIGDLFSNTIPESVEKKPCALRDIETRVCSDFKVKLPSGIHDRFGLRDFSFVEMIHPDSKSFVYVGYEKEEGKDVVEKPLEDALCIIELKRGGTEGYSYGSPPSFERLVPTDVIISGVDSYTGLTMMVDYFADYHGKPLIEVKIGSGITYCILDSDAPFVLKDVYLFVSDRDKNLSKFPKYIDPATLGGMRLCSQEVGWVTKGMIRKSEAITSKQATGILIVTKIRGFAGQPLLDNKMSFSYPTEDELSVNRSNGVVQISSRGSFELQLPETLPKLC